MLEDLDDVQQVYSNVEISGEILAEIRLSAIRIIGVDPGSRSTGYGIVESDGSRLVHVGERVRARPSTASGPAGCAGSSRSSGAVIDTHAPDEFAIEKVFMHRNPSSALKLGQARGVAILAGALRSLSVHEYSPNEIKQAVTGKGHASKEQIQYMAKVLLSLREPPQTDQADALARSRSAAAPAHHDGASRSA